MKKCTNCAALLPLSGAKGNKLPHENMYLPWPMSRYNETVKSPYAKGR